ncbi:MAG: primosomal replication protein PriB/PriC domain protein [Dyella sp.]|uniref:primosomal replication protein PriB/PriC domain protein n=1 Tax=Dyella sp. TaxID=1869338 RepID=UPI003F816D30
MSQATDMLQLYIDAEAKVLAGQAVEWGDRKLTRANLAEIRAGRAEWQRAVNREKPASAGGGGYSLANFSGCDR